MTAKQLFHASFNRLNLRVMRATRYRSSLADIDRSQRAVQEHLESRLADAYHSHNTTQGILEARIAALQTELANANTRAETAEAECKKIVNDLLADEAAARAATQLEPKEIPRVPGSFFLKAKVDYPGIFQPNPPHYRYQAVESVLRSHLASISRTAAALQPYMYGTEMETLPTSRVNSIDPHWNNGMFERDDARAAYAMTTLLKPRRILEVGSGNSTKFFRKAITDHNLSCDLVCVDPMPRAEIKAVADKVIYQHVKDLDLNVFESLEDGDFLFWDGSHITFNGTDTTHFYLTVLPRIKSNVIIHVHDIQLPYEYEAGYSAHYYNEQYMLGTLLINTSEWQPVLPVFWLKRLGLLKHGGISFWLARKPICQPAHTCVS